MSHTERRQAYGQCYEANCTWCVQGLAKRWAKRKARKQGRQEAARQLREADT